MSDNKNELHKFENEKSKDNTSIRIELDITETTDNYPEFDFLDLLRNKQVENRKAKGKQHNHEEHVYSEEDSEAEALARLYEEKYGTCNDYAELGEGYDEEDSFIDNTDAVNDLVPNGIQTELGGFYINRGKLTFVKEDNSSSSTSEDVDKFLAHNRLNVRRITSDDENDDKGKESGKVQSNNNNNDNNHHSSNNYNTNSHNNAGIVKSRKRSGEFQHKSKKIRKTATPKIPDHLLHKKPFSGSSEFRKNINEIRKNKLKNTESDKKPEGINSNIVNSKKEVPVKKKPATVKELLKERDGASEVIEAVATGADLLDKESSSSSESTESSSSSSESDSSDETTDKVPTSVSVSDEASETKRSSNEMETEDVTAKTIAHLNDNLKDLMAKITEISKADKNKDFNSKLNSLLLSVDVGIKDLPLAEKSAILDQLASILQMKRENITKRTKKLLFQQEEVKMSVPLRKLKQAITDMIPVLDSNYFKEFTKAAGTSPQIYAELSRYYWSIDPSTLPQRKFPWNDELRGYLRELVQLRKNCYYIIRPRKESVTEYVRTYLETKVKPFCPKWLTVDSLMEEAQMSQTSGQVEEKQKAVTKIFGAHNASNVQQKKAQPPSVSVTVTATASSSVTTSPNVTINRTSKPPSLTVTPNRKPTVVINKSPEVKSVLVPRKTPQGSSNSSNIMNKPNVTTSTSPNAANLLNRNVQVPFSRANMHEYLDRVSTTISRTSTSVTSHISPNRPQPQPQQSQQQQQRQQQQQQRQQQSVSPSRLVKNVSPSPCSVSNQNSTESVRTLQNSTRPNVTSRSSSPNSVKALTSFKMRNNTQSVLKTIELHSNPIPTSRNSPNSVTISSVSESMLKEVSSAPEILNLTKNSSVYISKVTDSSDSVKRSNSPSINIPLPSGITISPTNATASNFLSNKPQKPIERTPEVKINVSLTKQEPAANKINSVPEKRETVSNVKREGPLQNIPDCISVTSKTLPNEKHKYEHVRKRALQEYHQQHSPERLKLDENCKKLKTDDCDDVKDDKKFSKMFDNFLAKTSETVRQSETATAAYSNDRYSLTIDAVNSIGGFSSKPGMKQISPKGKVTKNLLVQSDNCGFNAEEADDKAREKNLVSNEQSVQIEMDRVMKNLIELSSQQRNPDYDSMETQHINLSSPPPAPSPKPRNSGTFQEVFQKMCYK